MTKRNTPLRETPHPSLPQSGEGAFCHPEQLEHHHPELDSESHSWTKYKGLNRGLHKKKTSLEVKVGYFGYVIVLCQFKTVIGYICCIGYYFI